MADRSARKLAGSVGLAFLAGFVAVLIFHQGMLGLLHALGVTPGAPFNLGRTAPFGIPEVVSSAFWGGIWAVALSLVLRRLSGPPYWLAAIVFGALVLTAVAWFVVQPLKGQSALAVAAVSRHGRSVGQRCVGHWNGDFVAPLPVLEIARTAPAAYHHRSQSTRIRGPCGVRRLRWLQETRPDRARWPMARPRGSTALPSGCANAAGAALGCRWRRIRQPELKRERFRSRLVREVHAEDISRHGRAIADLT